MSVSSRLALPFIDAAQAQKHVTHNEALVDLDALVHLSVRARNATTPPSAPGEGDRYLVGAAATGAFAGKSGAVAAFDNGGWAFLAPRAGWRAYVEAENLLLLFDGTRWSDLGLALQSLQNLQRLGIGATADASNPISAKLNSALFAALATGDGGTGDLRFTLNKSAVGNSVSQLYQSNWSGRAETGLTGDDRYHIKVSADGATWRDALAIDPATGLVALPQTAGAANGLASLGADARVPLAQLPSAALGLVRAAGLGVSVDPFSIGDAFAHPGGTLTLVANGTWYVGVDLFTRNIIALPRLGHRGWVPLAKVTTSAAAATIVQQIAPALPASRIPRTLKKLIDGAAINVVVMGSSLTQGGNTTDWPGMLFNAASSLAAYRVPNATAQYRGIGGAPNQYQLAQLGLATSQSALTYLASGWPGAVTPKGNPNGRSQMFSGVDLVILGCLANGGDYRLQTIEPMVRKLRALGVEVVLVTDDPQIATPWTQNYAALTAAALYVDGPEILRVADLYGVEVADTAAYVVDATLRYPANGAIYGIGETIHMATGAPAGRAAAPSCGHEVWARAVRSVVTIDGAPVAQAPIAYDFASGVQGWTAWGAAALAAPAGALVATLTGNAQGAQSPVLPVSLAAGDTIALTYDCATTGTVTGLQIGLQGGGWASNVAGAAFGTGQTALLTATKACVNPILLFYAGAASAGATVTIDNLSMVATNAAIADRTPGRAGDLRPMPPIRVVTDYRTPADAFVILPADEAFLTSGNAARGTLGAHPWGANSFARCFSQSVGATADLLTLGPGKSLMLSGHNVVGFALIRYADQNDAAVTFDVYRNATKVAASSGQTLAVAPFANEWFTPVIPPTTYAKASATDDSDALMLTVTSGTLKVAAIVALTADQDFFAPEEIGYVGTWLAKENSRSGLPGYPTDTLGAYASLRCTGRRVQWIVSGNPGSMPYDALSDREQALAQTLSGTNYHVHCVGGLLGPGADHVIRCAQANGSGSQANGHALHVGGAIVVNDR